MRFGIFNKFGAANSHPVFAAFGRALGRLGHAWQPHDSTADAAVIWSVLWSGRMRANRDIWTVFRNTGRPVVVLEVGMLRRGHTWKMGINGTGQDAIWVPVLGPGRAQQLNLNLQAWQRPGSDIVVALQRTDSEQWQGLPDISCWIRDTVDALRVHTDRPIRIRPHPRQRVQIPAGCTVEIPRPIPGTYDDFDFDHGLRTAWCVVNWNSGPGCQSVIQGVPAFVGASSLAAPVAGLDWSRIEQPVRPERQDWFDRVCHTEWTVEEIAQGDPVSALLGPLESG